MRPIHPIIPSGRIATLLLLVAVVQPSFAATERYTAQRKPRVTVFRFQDTNALADSARYGAAVEAMLVTFLKQKSQLVVVERQQLGAVLEEWERNQLGMTNLETGEPDARELLEKIDAVILGKVTLLKAMIKTPVAEKTDDEKQTGNPKLIEGQRIEIDVKLLSRADGRIIAAAQRRGPVTCLRSIVERLGVALEQEFLRPYYGKIKFRLADPANVRIFLTPILLDTAVDEEKPPVERSTTVVQDRQRDLVEPWTTDPTTYTIENIVSGWYTMRLERPGYEGLGTDNVHWVAREWGGKVRVYYQDPTSPRKRVPVDQVDPALGRFVVRVDPLSTEEIDGDGLGFTFRKKGGSVAPLVNRQYLKDEFAHRPERVTLKAEDLEINRLDPPEEYADDETCDLFEEREPNQVAYGRIHVVAGESFDFETFKGGGLVIDDYHGEIVPVGEYEMTLWEPDYETDRVIIAVRDQDRNKPIRTALVRSTASVPVAATGARKPHRMILEGATTGQRFRIPLDFHGRNSDLTVPVDRYVVSTDVPGLGAWRRNLALQNQTPSPPSCDPEGEEDLALCGHPEQDANGLAASTLWVKTRMGIGGGLAALGSLPGGDDVYLDLNVSRILDALLPSEQKPEKRRWRKALAGFGDILVAPFAALVTGRDATVELPSTNGSGGNRPPDAAAEGGPSEIAAATPEARDASGACIDADADALAWVLKPEPLPCSPAALRKLLAERLENLDLLVLDDDDMARLRERPEVAAIVERYVTSGGAVLAFISGDGDYGLMLGPSLAVETPHKRTRRFELASGEVPGIDLRIDKKKVRIKSRRRLPRLKKGQSGDWRVLAFTRGQQDPRIVERGPVGNGGYVAIWLDRPGSFRGFWGGRVPEVEAVRAAVEKRVLDWARYLMYRRYDDVGDQRARAEQVLAP